ncbi:MAG: hypothetical protein ACT4OX_07480 [Actinomycetota bacterium]
MRCRPLSFLVLLALATSACSGDDDVEARDEPPRTTTTVAALEFELERGDAAVASAGGDIVLDDAIAQAIVEASQRYVEVAVLAPLMEGAVDEGYETMFDAAVATDATGPDRAALTDEGIPTAVATPAVTATPVRVDAIADQGGVVLLMATTFNLDIRAESADGEMSVVRTNELTFAPGPDGNWLVTAYRVSATRDFGAVAATTTTAAAG